MYTDITIEKWKFLVKVYICLKYLQSEHKWWSVNEECLPYMKEAMGFKLHNGGEPYSPAPSSKILCYCKLLGSYFHYQTYHSVRTLFIGGEIS